MKKIITGIALFVAMAGVAHSAEICTDWGTFNACVPVTTGVSASFGYDFKNHHSHGLAETGFAKWRVASQGVLVFKAGGITTENGKGAPFLGVDYELSGVSNPIPGIMAIQPGIYAGHDFHANEDFYGVKASIPLIH